MRAGFAENIFFSLRSWKGKGLLKYTKQLPKTDKELSERLENTGWKKIREPKGFLSAVLFSLPLSGVLLLVTSYAAYVLDSGLFSFMGAGAFVIRVSGIRNLLFFAAAVYLYMFVHEMIHAIFIPNFMHSEKTEWGLNGAFGFVVTTEPLTKARFLLITCMPFILLSLLALLVFDLTGSLNGYTLALCLINAAGSIVDFLNFILAAVQVKNDAEIIANGFETYYRSAK